MAHPLTWLAQLRYWTFTALSLGIAGYAYAYLYQGFNRFDPFHAKFAADDWFVPVHFFFAATALALAPLQLSRRLRRRWVRAHRAVGLSYVVAVLAGGGSALALAPHAQGGLPAALGFSCLALAWIAVTARGLAAAVAGDLPAHRRWMLRSVALTFAAVTLRLMLGGGVALLGMPFDQVYAAASWLCWILNLAVCELMLLRATRRVGAGTRWGWPRGVS